MADHLSQPPPPANRLLARLPAAEYDRLLPHLRPVPLKLDQVLHKARTPISHVYFPTGGVTSALTVLEDGAAIEVATVGNEGVVGSTAFLGAASSPHKVIVQVAGDGLRMDARVLAAEARSDGPLWDLLVRYHTAFLAQVSQSVACNGLHAVGQRCCRWLLMTHDRVGTDAFHLTHEHLAMMLGVRRQSVSLVLQPLQDRGLIAYRRGAITVRDRKGLEVAVCECYQLVRDEFARLLGDSG
jgi:CRP-like cAMP-binding protein